MSKVNEEFGSLMFYASYESPDHSRIKCEKVFLNVYRNLWRDNLEEKDIKYFFTKNAYEYNLSDEDIEMLYGSLIKKYNLKFFNMYN